MYPASRRKLNTINLQSRFRVLVYDINNRDGRPWSDLLGNPLELIWNICRGDQVLCRGKVASDGWIDARLREPFSARDLVLNVGPPAVDQGPDDDTLPPSQAEFEWCESHVISSVAETWSVEEAKGAQLRLELLAFHAGEIDGDVGPITKAALREFQDVWQIQVNGESDTQTQKKLEEQIEKLDAEKPA